MTHNSKRTEEKAVLAFKNYISNSQKISQFVAENDKTPFWDGEIFLYRDSDCRKEDFIDSISVQIKGTNVKEFNKIDFRYGVDVSDLKAYRNKATLYIVCQLKESEEGKTETLLTYSMFLPEKLKRILSEKRTTKTRSVLMRQIPNDIKSFEEMLLVFVENKKRQQAFIDKKTPTLEEAVTEGRNEFYLVIPPQINNIMEQMAYLSSTEGYIYTKAKTEWEVDVPLSGGPFQMSFCKETKTEIRIGDKKFYDTYKISFEGGYMNVCFGNLLYLSIEPKTGLMVAVIKSESTELDQVIKEEEFALCLEKEGAFQLENKTYEIKSNNRNNQEKLENHLSAIKDLRKVLKLLGVNSSLDLATINKDQEKFINLLVDCILHDGTFKLKDKNAVSCPMYVDLGNLNLLLWVDVDSKKDCHLCNFFDRKREVTYRISSDSKVDATAFSYLWESNLWAKCDNIPYEEIVDYYSAENITNEVIEHDILKMIGCADETKQKERNEKILETALSLSQYLIKSGGNNLIYNKINMLQIVKRLGLFSESDKEELRNIIEDSKKQIEIAAAYLLLEDRKSFVGVFNKLSDQERLSFMNWPISHFIIS